MARWLLTKISTQVWTILIVTKPHKKRDAERIRWCSWLAHAERGKLAGVVDGVEHRVELGEIVAHAGGCWRTQLGDGEGGSS